MAIKPIQFMLFMENLLSVYRNISFYGNRKRKLVYLHITVNILIIISSTVIYLYYDAFKSGLNVPFMVNSANSLLAIFIACYYCKEFKSLIGYLNINNSCYLNDSKYLENLGKLQISLLVIVFTAFVLRFGSLIYSFVDMENYFEDFLPYLLETNVASGGFRYYIEYLALYCILNVMSEQLDCITRSIDDPEINNSQSETAQKANHINKWNANFTNTKECSKLLNKIYSVQLTVMLASIIIFYVKFLYSFTSESIAGTISTPMICNFMIVMSLLLLCLMMVARAAQRVQNSADNLKRRLARLCTRSLANEDYYRATKDLLRLVATRSIRTQAFGLISVDMALVPKCVMLFTYYTVIALQFNNVV